MKKASDYVCELPFYCHLMDDEIEFIKNNLVIRKVHKGEIIYGCGTTCLGMSHIISGKLRVFIVSEDGTDASG